jgi:predicted ribosome quality control (RQC) complex YloA/Tae2 family protein
MSTSSSSQLEPTTLDASTVNLDELRKEAQRQLYRAQKKTAKAIDRVRVCEEKEKAVMEKADATLEELEALPNGDTLRTDAAAEQEREMKLLELVNGLQAATSRESATGDSPPVVAELVGLAAKLGVIAQDGSVSAPVRAPPKPTKPKGPRASTEPRLPYRVFRSESGAEIRVGKQASDNDVLSTDSEHRDGDDWWLHASGCPGSHVVVRARTVGASTLPRDVELDAAVLAANYSKAAKTGNVAVSLCRARQVSKPFGAKPGLVQLNGDVKTVKVDWRKEKHRLERLASTLSARDST